MVESSVDGRRSVSTGKTAAVVPEPTVAPGPDQPEPETETEIGHLLVLDMTSSAIETRRRRQRGIPPCDDASSDADRETALIAHVNMDDVAQMSSDSCPNSEQFFLSHYLSISDRLNNKKEGCEKWFCRFLTFLLIVIMLVKF